MSGKRLAFDVTNNVIKKCLLTNVSLELTHISYYSIKRIFRHAKFYCVTHMLRIQYRANTSPIFLLISLYGDLYYKNAKVYYSEASQTIILKTTCINLYYHITQIAIIIEKFNNVASLYQYT